MDAVELKNITMTFKEVKAVDNMSLVIQEGEFLALLGPSGCGKTTTLRVIAGFERADSGEVYLSGENITDKPPYKRNIGMVFQNYALFPHMTVFDNIAFGLRMRGRRGREITERVQNALKLVRMEGLGRRYPRQLSGGQQQRVALARAIAIEPSVLLLDEPLSNLDAKLREEMRIELRQIQKRIGITTIFVTHDQEEALTLSDRLVLMNCGRVEQIGTPIEIYEKPRSTFTANFIGQSNFLRGKVVAVEANGAIIITDTGLQVCADRETQAPVGSEVLVVIRLGRMKIAPAEEEVLGGNVYPAKVEFVTYLGSSIQYICSVGKQKMAVITGNEVGTPLFRIGDDVKLTWQPGDCIVIKE
ncbi:MAG: ABC transporter ATP-binding protein [Chloroflexi bacterium]|nr:ABC transporter ATP-binding protein [Chloroflexota bacterium]MCL5075878.1 ABC transporter ATP-binding protein [Chloroflexota bacterium]